MSIVFRQYYFILSIFISLISYAIVPQIIISEITCAWCIIAIYFLNFLSIWHSSDCRLTLLSLFYLTFGLFILGRFFAYVLGYHAPLWDATFYYDYYISDSRKIEIVYYLFGYIIAINIGAYLSRIRRPSSSIELYVNRSLLTLILEKAFVVLLFITVISGISTFISVMNGGYLSMYLDGQNSDYSGGSSLINTLSLTGFGLAYGYSNDKCQKKYLILFIINACLAIMSGARGSFGTLLLTMLWLYSKHHKMSLLKIFVLCLGAVTLLLLVFSMSVRAVNSGWGENQAIEILLDFIYNQGVSLMVFDTSRLIDNYPILPFVQSLIPGSSVFYSLISGEALSPWDVSFASYMCHSINPELFSAGMGLGWTSMSDCYVFSCGFFPLYIFLAIAFFYIIGRIEIDAKKSRLCRSIAYTIIMPLLTYPRAGLNNIAPLVVYLLILIVTISLISQINYKTAAK